MLQLDAQIGPYACASMDEYDVERAVLCDLVAAAVAMLIGWRNVRRGHVPGAR